MFESTMWKFLSVSIYISIILIAFSGGALGAGGLTMQEFGTILHRACVDKVITEESEREWQASTLGEWEKITSKAALYAESTDPDAVEYYSPYILSSYVDLSGYRRKVDLDTEFGLSSYENGKDGGVIDLGIYEIDNAVYNGEEFSSYQLNLPASFALEIKEAIETMSDDFYSIQPLLPSCKISSNAISLTSMFTEQSLNTIPIATVVVSFASYSPSSGNQTPRANSVLSLISSRGSEERMDNMKNCFSSFSSTHSRLPSVIPNAAISVKEGFAGRTASFKIDRRMASSMVSEQENEVNQADILSLMSGFALQPAVTEVSIRSEIKLKDEDDDYYSNYKMLSKKTKKILKKKRKHNKSYMAPEAPDEEKSEVVESQADFFGFSLNDGF